MRFGLGRGWEGEGAAREVEGQDPEKIVDRAIDSIKELAEKSGTLTELSKKARTLRAGALLVGLMIPNAALGYGPHRKVQELNTYISGMEKIQEKLQQQHRGYQYQAGQKARTEIRSYSDLQRARQLAGQRRVDRAADEVQEYQEEIDRMVERRDKVSDRITEKHEKRGERRAAKGKSSLELYEWANDRVDQYLHQAGVKENGRSLVVELSGGSKTFIDIPYEYEVDNFPMHRNDLTIVLLKSDGSYRGLYFENGSYVYDAPCSATGDKL